MAQVIKTTHQWILELLKTFGAIREDQMTKLLKMKFPTATLEKTVVPMLTNRMIKRSEGYFFSKSGRIDDKIIEAIDIMLLIEPDISQGFIRGKGDPVVLSFFKERQEEKLWHYDICPIAYGTEIAVASKLINTNQKYRMIVFVPEKEEQMDAINISCEHCYVLKNSGNYEFYRSTRRIKMDFRELDLREMDKDLTAEEQKEWNSIYASYRGKSVLSGRVVGIDSHSITARDEETGLLGRKNILNLVVISYRVKVLIPHQEAWFNPETERPEHVFRSMVGSVIEYVITGIDRENECCVASRREALMMRGKTFAKYALKVGRKINIDILAVGNTHLLASYSGYDVTLSQRDLSYGMMENLKDKYQAGQTHTAIYKGYDIEKNNIIVSVKEAKPHPFDGVETRHPLNCRRASKISGKYKGGVFCKLEEELDCLCIYSQYECDEDYDIGDTVIVAVTKFDYGRRLVYGKIVAKI